MTLTAPGPTVAAGSAPAAAGSAPAAADGLFPDDAVLAFRHGVRVQPDAEALVVLYDDALAFRLRNASPALAAVLARLTSAPAAYREVLAALDQVGRRQLVTVVGRMRALLVRCVVQGERELLRVEARALDAGYAPHPLTAGTPVRLSKFAYFQGRADALVLESPTTAHRAAIADPAVREAVTRLGTPLAAQELATDDLSAAALTEVLSHLAGAGFLDVGTRADEGAAFAADDDDVLRQWEFHDLLFHTRSRFGRHDSPHGGRFPYVGQIAPQPAVKPPPGGPTVELHRPRLSDILDVDAPLVAVMEGRRSVRSYGERPLTARQLGEFLYRVARVRGTYGPRPGQGMPYEGSSRPYPCGGAGYELELYLTVRRCDGIAPGIWFYDPEHHRLHLVNDDPADRDAMVGMASMSAGGKATPDVVVTMTSRFQRLSWKYQSIAYSVTLKHVGVLYQSMYLVATAMGLAPCGLGSGSLDLATRILGLDYLRESPVGEFMLGSLPAVAAPATGPAVDDWRGRNDPQWAEEARHRLSAGHLPPGAG